MVGSGRQYGFRLSGSGHKRRLLPIKLDSVEQFGLSPFFQSIPSCSRHLAERQGAITVIKADLRDIYRDYIACLNRQDWPKLEQFVGDDVHYNGRRIGLSGYREMLERDVREIPDLHFNIDLLISDPPYIASRLRFDCTPRGTFLGLPVNGKRVSFAENVF